MNRPLLCVALFYVAGILAARLVHLPPVGLLSVSLLAGLACFFPPMNRPAGLPGFLVLCGMTAHTLSVAELSPVDLRRRVGDEPVLATVRGRLTETPEQHQTLRRGSMRERITVEIRVESIQRGGWWEPAAGRVRATAPGRLGEAFFRGRTVEVTGVLARPETARAGGLFDYRAHLQNRGIYYTLETEGAGDWKLVDAVSGTGKLPWPERFQTWARATLARGLPGEDEPLRLLWAMALGWRTGLNDEVAEPFMRSGMLHVFAISGLHVALIAGILISLLRVLRVPRAACGWVAIPLLWFYTAATGWQPSATRSTLMMTIIIGGWALRRPSDLLNSLAAAALIILLWDPLQLFQAGFQLSFLVVLGIALIAPPIRCRLERWRWGDPLLPDELRPRWQRWLRDAQTALAAALATSLAAWLASAPLMATYFNLVSPVGVLANLVIVPVSGLALASCLGSLLTGALWPWLGELFNHAAWGWMSLMARGSEWLAGWPGAFFYVRSPAGGWIAAYVLLLAAGLKGWLWEWRRWPWLGPALVMLAVWGSRDVLARRHETRLTVLPLGGSGLVIDAPGRGQDLLIDCADEAGAEFLLRPFLRAQGWNRLPHLVLSHADTRHLGGFESVCRDFRPKVVHASPLPSRSTAMQRVRELGLTHRGTRFRAVYRGGFVGPWRVLHPLPGDRFARADDGAVVLAGNIAGTRVLVLPDLGETGQRALLAREPELRSDIVISSLPARGEPLIPPLLEAIQPRLIVLAGANHPASARPGARLLNRLAQPGRAVVSTHALGAVTLVLRESGWECRDARWRVLAGPHPAIRGGAR